MRQAEDYSIAFEHQVAKDFLVICLIYSSKLFLGGSLTDTYNSDTHCLALIGDLPSYVAETKD